MTELANGTTKATTLLALGRPDFAALLARPHPWALGLKRRLASLSPHGSVFSSPLAGSLGRYLRRLATFNDFDPVALPDFLT